MEDDLDVQFLGEPVVRRGGIPVRLPSRRATAVLAHVVCLGRPVGRSALAALVWPDSDSRTALGNLRVVLSQLRRDVGRLIRVHGSVVQIDDDARSMVDVHRFEDMARRGLTETDPARARPQLVDAHRTWQGPLLTGMTATVSAEFDDWLDDERSRLHLRHVRVLDALVRLDLDARPTIATVELARRLVAEDPLREASQQLLMRAQWHTGDRAGALRGFDRWRERWHREMGRLEPRAGLHDLAEAIRRDDPSLSLDS